MLSYVTTRISSWCFHHWDLLTHQIPLPPTQKEELPVLDIYQHRHAKVLSSEGRIEYTGEVLKAICNLVLLNIPFTTRNGY